MGVLDDVLDVDAHLVHRAGDFFDGGGSLDAHFGRFVGGAGDLTGAGGDLGGPVAHLANEELQTVRHANECVAQCVALRARRNLHRKIALCDGHGNSGYFFQVGDHVVEGRGQRADLISAVNVDVLIEIAGVADFARDGNQMIQRFGDGLCRVESNGKSDKDGGQSAEDGDDSAKHYEE